MSPFIKAFIKIFSNPGALATLLGAIIATVGIPLGVWLSSSSENRKKKRESKAEIASEILFLVSMIINEIVENFRLPLDRSEAQTKLLIDRYNDLSMRLAEALHKANYILVQQDLVLYGAVKNLLEKFFLCKRAEAYNKTVKEGAQSYFPYPIPEII